MAKLRTFNGTKEHKVVSRQKWIAARKRLLAREKKFNKLRDTLCAQRRELPWVKIEKDYVFDGPKGKQSLSDLFAGKSQLLIYHFMFGPAWKEGCAHCSFWADHFDSVSHHIGQRDTTFAVVSRAASKKLQAFKKRMGWRFNWVSSIQSDFNYDFHVSFTPKEIRSGKQFYNYRFVNFGMDELQGVSAFYKDSRGDIYHTYSAYARGIDLMNTTYNFLDLTAKGRDENPKRTQEWVRFHDRYKPAKRA